MSIQRDLKKLKRLEDLVAVWKVDKNQFARVVKTINDEELWRLVGNSLQELLALEFGIPEGHPFSVMTGEVVPF
jgi:hypothetical protein